MENKNKTLNEAENGNKSKPLLSSRLFSFRAWDTDNDEFVNCEDHQIRQMQTDYGGLGNRFIYSQFTGLKDKNGKEIYEGDIVNDSDLGKGIVIFQSGCFFMMYDADANLEFLGLKTDKFGRLQEKRIVEILGNIYENPELL